MLLQQCFSGVFFVYFKTSKLVSRESFGNEIAFLLHTVYPAVVLIVAVKHHHFKYYGSLKHNFFSFELYIINILY